MLELSHPDADVREAVATRAAMLERQGIDGALAYSHSIVSQIQHEQDCERAHQLAERAVRVILLLVILGCYFGWLA